MAVMSLEANTGTSGVAVVVVVGGCNKALKSL